MKQIVLTKPRTLVLQTQDDMQPCQADEVKIKVKVVTICGSDSSYFQVDTLPHNLVYPLILGHEVAGKVIEVGCNVHHLHIGDRVAIEPSVSCGQCIYCKRGDYNFCSSLRFMASKGTNGALQEILVYPSKHVYRLPEHMGYEEGALLEPLSVAYSAIEKMKFTSDAQVVILGAGAIGMLVGKLMSILYPDVDVYLVDIYEEKRALGMAIGLHTSQFLLPSSNQVRKPFTHMVDTTGSSALVKKYIGFSMNNVTLVEIGVSDQPLDLTCKELVYQGITIIGSYRYTHTYPKLLALYEANKLDMNHIITKRYSYLDAQQAFMEARNTKDNIKVAITF